MTTEKKMASPYRGNCEALKAINEVPIDISLLAQESTPAFEGEPVRKFFPVRSQVTWFRLKNGNAGTIQTDIVSRDEFMVVMKATVTIDGVAIANAFGSADTQTDGQNGDGIKLIEAAESRAIARALDFAGYGCQLDLNTFGTEEPQAAETAPAGSPDEAAPTEVPAAPAQPGVMTGKSKVDANAPSEIIDIHDLEAAAPEEQPEEKPVKKRRSKADKEATIPVSDPPADVGRADEAPAQPVVTEDAGQQELSDPVAPEEAEKGASLQPDTEASPVEPEPEDPRTAEEKVWDYIMLAMSGNYPDPQLDPRFFNEQNQDVDAFFINGNNGEFATKMRNRDLQLAINFLENDQDLVMQIRYPSTRGQFAGRTFGEIYGTLGTNIANQAVENCKNLYHGKNVPAYAATLLLVEMMNKR